MIIGECQRPGVGECYLDKTRIINSSYVLRLMEESGRSIGEILIVPDIFAKDRSRARELKNLKVPKELRGNGLGSLLMSRAIEITREDGMETVKTGLGNERTLSAFCGNFTPDQIVYIRKKLGRHMPFEELAMGQEEILARLTKLRGQQFEDPNSDEHLIIDQETLYARAVLL